MYLVKVNNKSHSIDVRKKYKSFVWAEKFALIWVESGFEVGIVASDGIVMKHWVDGQLVSEFGLIKKEG